MSEAAPSNGYDRQRVEEYVGRVEELNRVIEKANAEHARKIKAVKEDIKLVINEAGDAGLPKKELKIVVKIRELERRAEAMRDDREDDEQDRIDLLRHALGDLDDDRIRDAALARSQQKTEGDKAVDNLAAG